MAKIPVLTIYMCLAFCVTSVYPCYFTDCPNAYLWSSKRKPSQENLEVKRRIRECPKCGPDNKGECFSTSWCCVEGEGCTNDLILAASCHEEQFYLDLCLASKDVCFVGIKNDNTEDLWGVCVDGENGVCCGPSGCSRDVKCLKKKSIHHQQSSTRNRDSDNELFRQILNKLSQA